MRHLQLVLVIFFVMACGDNRPLELTDSSVVSQAAINRRQACNNLDLFGNATTHQNTINLLICLGLEQLEQQLVQNIDSIGSDDWDKALGWIGQGLFTDAKKRGSFFKRVAYLKFNHGFDQLDRLFKHLGEKHSKAISLLIEQMDENTLSDLINLVMDNKEIIPKLAKDLSHLFAILESNQDKWIEIIEHSRNSVEISTQKINFINSALKSLDSKKIKLTMAILRHWQNEAKIHLIIKRSNFTSTDFEKLFTLTSQYPGISDSLNKIKPYINSYQECSSSRNINFKTELTQLIKTLMQGSREQILDATIDSLSKLAIFESICSSNNYDSMLMVHNIINELISNPEWLDIISYLHVSMFEQDNEESLFYLIDLIGSKFIQDFNSFNLQLNHKTGHLSQVYDLIVGYGDQILEKSSVMVEILSQKSGLNLIESFTSKLEGLSETDKNLIISLVEDILFNAEFKPSELVQYWSLFLDQEIDILTNIQNNLGEKNESNRKAFLRVVKRLFESEEKTRSVLRFMTRDHLIGLLRIFSKDIFFEKSVKLPIQEIIKENTILESVVYTASELEKIRCINELNIGLRKVNFLPYMVNQFNDICSSADGYVLTDINQAIADFNYFLGDYDDLDAGLLFQSQFTNKYLDLILSFDHAFKSNGGVSRVLSELSIINTDFDLTRILYPALNLIETDLEQHPSSSEKFLDLGKFNDVLNFSLDFFKFSFKPVRKSLNHCRAEFNYGQIDCSNHKILTETYKNIFDLFIDKPNDLSLLDSLINLFDPAAGIDLPILKKKQDITMIELKDLLTLFYDLSGSDTREDIDYIDENGHQFRASLNILERLEIVIREISFLNNFYGAHFKNEVSKARNYYKKLKGLKFQVNLMEKSSGLMEKWGLLPSESSRRLFNVKQSYDSLIQSAETINSRNHAKTLQALIGSSVLASSPKSQKFNPFKLPNPADVNGHQGQLLVNLANLGLMKNISSLLHNSFTSLEDFNAFINSDFINQVNNSINKPNNLKLIRKIMNQFFGPEDYEIKKDIFVKLLRTISKLDHHNLTSVMRSIGEILALSSELSDINPEINNKHYQLISRLMDNLYDRADHLVVIIEAFAMSLKLTPQILSGLDLKEGIEIDEINLDQLPNLLHNGLEFLEFISAKYTTQEIATAFNKLKVILNKNQQGFYLIKELSNLDPRLFKLLMKYIGDSDRLDQLIAYLFQTNNQALAKMLQDAAMSFEVK